MLFRKEYISGILVIHLFLILGYAHARPALIFNTTGQPPLNKNTYDGFMDEITRTALSRIGYKLVINRLPAERALRSINSGLIDGEMSRVKGLDKLYPNLIRVPEKIMDWEFVVYSKKQINLQYGWDSLTNKNIAFITGWKILENNVPESAIITKTDNSQQLFKMLEKNRADYIIYEKWGGKHMIKEKGLNNVYLQLPPLARKEMFIYLNKKHAALVEKLSASLRKMKADGSYQKLVDKHLTSLLLSD